MINDKLSRLVAQFSRNPLHTFLSSAQIVEDVSVTPRKSAVLPGLTLCPYPGFRLQTNPVDIDSYCQEGEEVSADCLDKIL